MTIPQDGTPLIGSNLQLISGLDSDSKITKNGPIYTTCSFKRPVAWFQLLNDSGCRWLAVDPALSWSLMILFGFCRQRAFLHRTSEGKYGPFVHIEGSVKALICTKLHSGGGQKIGICQFTRLNFERNVTLSATQISATPQKFVWKFTAGSNPHCFISPHLLSTSMDQN